MLYKDKLNVKDTIRAVNTDGQVIINPKTICDIFNEWFHSVFRVEDVSILSEFENSPHVICPQICFKAVCTGFFIPFMSIVMQSI